MSTSQSSPSSSLTWSYIPTLAAPLLTKVVELLISQYATEKDLAKALSLIRAIQGAQISLSMIEGEMFLATASGFETYFFPSITEALVEGSQQLDLLINGYNWFDTKLNLGVNAFYTAVFGAITVLQLGLMIWLRFIYFGVCVFLGAGIEFAGYLVRTLAYHNQLDLPLFLTQIVALTIAPVFIMAAIYYTLGQVIVIHGRQYSILNPLTFSYLFISCDIISLILQGVGGSLAAVAAATGNDPSLGTHIMIAGVSFQLLSMTIFMFLLGDMVVRAFFRASPNVLFLMRNLLHMMLNTGTGQALKLECEPYYNPRYLHVRALPFFNFAPLVMLVATLFIYIRCAYRVAELSQGWQGHLITHEAYVMTLDAALVFLACLVVTIAHPSILMRPQNKISLLDMKRQRDMMVMVNEDYEERPRPKSEKTNGDNRNPFESPISETF